MLIIPSRFSKIDVESRVSWINNPLINENMFFDLPASVEQTNKWYERIQNNVHRVDFSFRDDLGDLLAMGGFTEIDSKHKNAEFYVMVNPLYHGRGIGKKVSIWMYNYAFSVLKLHKIYLYTNDSNVAAYTIYENAGFTLEGVLRKHKIKGGEFQNRRIYGLLKEEWDRLNWKEILDEKF